MKTRLTLTIDYDEACTDPEGLACALDRLLETALSTPGILDEYGPPQLGEFLVDEPPTEDDGACDCEQPGPFCSGVPGVLARIEQGRLVGGTVVERCDLCRRYPSDQAALQRLIELGLASAPDTSDPGTG
jgi:hypothetical protein